MLTHLTHGDRGPHIYLLHWLGGSARTWQWVAPALAAYGYRVTAIDLPGFGDSANLSATDVAASTEQLLVTLRALRAAQPDAPWLLCGHSMGGKFASIVARAALDGDPTLAGLRGLFLVSPSPPCPEPMKEEKRQQLLETLGNPEFRADEFREAARRFIEENTGAHPLMDAVSHAALDDLERLSRAAFRAWFTTGSREDWTTRVGTMALPAMVLAGNKEGPLCAEEQAELLPTYLPTATLVTLEGSGHLAPLERPLEVADRIAAFAVATGVAGEPQPSPLTTEFQRLLDSDSTSQQTRAAMKHRLEPQTQHAFTPDEVLSLRALLRAIIPSITTDKAEQLANNLASPQGNGWRFDDLPSPLEAWKLGLLSLEHASRADFSVSFTALEAISAHKLLTRASEGKLSRTLADTALPGDEHATLTAAQMQHWMEDVRGECAKLYVADPRTMDRIGFRGFADNHGFTKIRLEEQA